MMNDLSLLHSRTRNRSGRMLLGAVLLTCEARSRYAQLQSNADFMKKDASR